MAVKRWMGRRHSDECDLHHLDFHHLDEFKNQASKKKALRRGTTAGLLSASEDLPLQFARQESGTEYYHTMSMQEELSRDKNTVGRRNTFLVIVYFGLGMFVGHSQGWSIIDSFYATVVTFTTVGYGDFSFGKLSFGAHDDDGGPELLGVVFIILGVFVFGIALSALFSHVLENEQAIVFARARERELGNERSRGQTLWQRIRTRIRRLVAPVKESQVGLAQSIKDEVQGRLKVSLLIALVRDTIILFVSAGTLGTIEGWSWQEAIYWAVSTATTVGYGDVVPTTQPSQLIASIFILLSVVSLTHTIGFVSSYRSMMAEVKARHEVLMQFGSTLTDEEFHTLTHGPEVRYLRLCSGGGGSITQAEFCLYMLVQLGRVSVEELFACQDAFSKLDISHSGKLDYTDLMRHEQARNKYWRDADEQALASPANSNGLATETSCGKCGNTYMPDSKFCRKCGKPRKGAGSKGNFAVDSSHAYQKECGHCGNVFMPDAKFCRKCGKPRNRCC